MTYVIQNAQHVINKPDVVTAMQILSQYGLGVMAPHMHNEVGGFVALPSDMVSCEEDLIVSFHREDSLPSDDLVPVAWRWDAQNGMVKVSGRCSPQGCDGM